MYATSRLSSLTLSFLVILAVFFHMILESTHQFPQTIRILNGILLNLWMNFRGNDILKILSLPILNILLPLLAFLFCVYLKKMHILSFLHSLLKTSNWFEFVRCILKISYILSNLISACSTNYC